MKKLALGLFALVLWSGCVICSVAPFYRSADLIMDAALVGEWMPVDGSSSETWKFEQAGADAYKLTHKQKDTAPTLSEARLFKLAGQLFLDIAQHPDSPTNDELFPPPIPSHILARIDQLKPTLRASIIKYDWIVESLDQDPKALRHHIIKKGDKLENREIVLTASTEDLQQFVLKHLKNPAAWADIEMKRLGK